MYRQLLENARALTAERFFLLLAVPVGLVLLLGTPAFQVPDEPRHFLRAYQLSELHLRGIKLGDKAGGFLPRAVVDYANNFTTVPVKTALIQGSDLRINGNDRVFAELPNTLLYSPVNYAPQVIAITLGRVFTSNPAWLFYLARLATLATWLALTYWGIKIMPRGRWLVASLSLLPMTVFEAASAAPDGVVYGVTVLSFAIFLKYALATARGETWQHSWLIIPAVVACAFIKLPYGLVSVVLLLPVLRQRRWKSLAVPLMGVAVVFAGALVWTVLSQRVYVVPNSWPTFAPEGINATEQLKLVLHHPLGYAMTIVNSVVTNSGNPILPQVVGNFGWLMVPIYGWAVALTYGYYGTQMIGEREKVLRTSERLFIAEIFIVIAVAMMTLLYLSWTPYGARAIAGIQGRYFLPLLPILAVAVGDQAKVSDRQKLAYIVVVALVLIGGAESIFATYHDPFMVLR